jgi:hypothetical protein
VDGTRHRGLKRYYLCKSCGERFVAWRLDEKDLVKLYERSPTPVPRD